jgi:hypothetical protein
MAGQHDSGCRWLLCIPLYDERRSLHEIGLFANQRRELHGQHSDVRRGILLRGNCHKRERDGKPVLRRSRGHRTLTEIKQQLLRLGLQNSADERSHMLGAVRWLMTSYQDDAS